jgi:hypothetical protein
MTVAPPLQRVKIDDHQVASKGLPDHTLHLEQVEEFGSSGMRNVMGRDKLTRQARSYDQIIGSRFSSWNSSDWMMISSSRIHAFRQEHSQLENTEFNNWIALKMGTIQVRVEHYERERAS